MAIVRQGTLAFDDKVILSDVTFSVQSGSHEDLSRRQRRRQVDDSEADARLAQARLWNDLGSRPPRRSTERERTDGVRHHMGMVFQEGALFDSLTVGENVGYKLYEETSMPLDEVRARVEEVLGFVNLRRAYRPDAVGAVWRAAATRRHCPRDGREADVAAVR